MFFVITKRAASPWPRVGETRRKMLDDVDQPPTGPVSTDTQRPADEEQGTFILLPIIGEPDVQIALFSDGSYARWYTPRPLLFSS
jgi:hypothetical protein